MDERELIHRALDGELDAAAMQRLEACLSQGHEFRRRFESAKALQTTLRELPVPADPGAALTERIIARLPLRVGSGYRWRWLLRPIRVPLLGVVAAGALATVLLALSLHASLRRPTVRSSAETTIATAPVNRRGASQHCTPKREIVYRFFLAAHDARSVSVVGDFNDWSEQGTRLIDHDGDGIWTTTVVLSPGRYQYKFLVDGKRWVVGPDAPAVRPDGFGGRNGLLTI